MPRQRSDWINWRLVRRTAILPVIAVLLAMFTSFGQQSPPAALLPPAFTDEQGAELGREAAAFDKLFPDRRAGTPGALEAAEWVKDRFTTVGLETAAHPTTTQVAGEQEPRSLLNVEGVLPGRTAERVYLVAARDTATPQADPRVAVGTLALVALAEELAASRDRRRTYVFVSTDGSATGAGGATDVARRIAKEHRDQTVAVFVLDRIGVGRSLEVAYDASGDWAPPLGLTRVLRDAIAEEGASVAPQGVLSQLGALATPWSPGEAAPFIAAGLPAVRMSGDGTPIGRGEAPASVEGIDIAAAVRSVQRATATLDGVDALQTSGKTYVSGEDRVYRGWALKIIVAALLAPAWMAAATLLLRMRARVNLAFALGSVSRAAIGGIWLLISFWVVGLVGLIPRGADTPVAGVTLPEGSIFALVVWALLGSVGWLLARGPDSHRRDERGADAATRAVASAALVFLAVLSLAIQPYTVLLFVPLLYALLLTSSTWVPNPLHRAAALAVGIAIPLLAGAGVAARHGAGGDSLWYWLVMAQAGSIPAGGLLMIAMATGVLALVGITLAGRTGRPAIIRLRGFLAHQRSLRARQVLPPRLPEQSRGSTTGVPTAGRTRVKSRYSGQKASERP